MVKGNFFVETVGDEVYVWYKGQLLYKRWLRLGYGRLL